MKRRIGLLLGLTPLIAGGISLAATSNQIVGTAHDFSANGHGIWSSGEICKPCHTPHNAAPREVSTRLWNHKLTEATYETKYGTLNAVDALDRISRLCMSCHDGTVAMDAFGGGMGTAAGTMGESTKNLSMMRDANMAMFKPGTPNLTNDHPVGNYAAYDTNPGSHYNTTGTVSGSNFKVNARTIDTTKSVTVYGATSGPNAGKPGVYIVSCYTCHNPHGSGVTVDGVPNKSLLRVTSDGSSLCLTCHNK